MAIQPMNKRHLELRVRARDAIDVARAVQLESRRIVAHCMEARVEARRAVSS